MEAEKTEVPAWLDKQFVETLLRENEDDSITVQNLTVQMAVSKGDNYMSQLHRVGVDLTREGKSDHQILIVKSLPPFEFFAKFIVEGNFFERESRMYEETLPAMYDLEAASTGCEVKTFSARCYKTSRPSTIVLEDLRHSGFKMAQRHRGLDLRHTKVALKAFARLHALSIGLAARDPTSMDHYGEPFHKEDYREKNTQFFKPLVSMLASNVEKWEGFKRFGDKLRNIDWVDCGIQMATVKEGDITVLNHGDGWTNNMLFQYDDTGEVQAIKFVDFQISRYASPALDLQYFMHTSPSVQVREKHWDEVIEHYYKSFVEALKIIELESKAFSFEALKEEIQEKMMFGLLTACTVLPIVLVDPENTPDMSNLTEDNVGVHVDASNMGKSFHSKLFKEAFGNLLLHFESMGFL